MSDRYLPLIVSFLLLIAGVSGIYLEKWAGEEQREIDLLEEYVSGYAAGRSAGKHESNLRNWLSGYYCGFDHAVRLTMPDSNLKATNYHPDLPSPDVWHSGMVADTVKGDRN